MYYLWRAESVEILLVVLNQLLDPKGPQAAGWYDHRFGGRGIIGTPVGAYATGGGRRGVHHTLVIVVETPDGSRQEVHWRQSCEAMSLAYWLSLILRTVAGKYTECHPLHEQVVGYMVETLCRYGSHGGKLEHSDIPAAIDRWNRKMFYHHHQPLVVDLKPVPTIR